jgi:hypothetical protein
MFGDVCFSPCGIAGKVSFILFSTLENAAASFTH